MSDQLYEKYAILDSKIKSLLDEKEILRDLILDELTNSPESAVSTPVGKFSVSKLKTWTYTEAVSEKSEELKALKAQEESTGEATFEEKPSLRFTMAKF